MSATTHHENHPDAEILSAFAEQALSAKERSEVLEHLAVCGRCREIFALARQAAGAEFAPARPEVVHPRAWWRSWGLALVPAAAVAATAVIAIYVHQRGVERAAEVAKLEQLRTAEKMPMIPQAAPQPQAAAVPPAAPRSAPPKSHKPELTSATRRAPIAEPEETAAEPPSEVINGLLSRREEPAETPGFERHRSADESFVRAGAAPEGTPPTEAAAYDEERKKKAEEESEDRRQLAAKAPMPSDGHSSESATAVGGAPANNQPVDVSAQQLETQPAPAAANLQLHGLRSMVNVATGPYAFHLPSGRLAVSIASADHRTLAVDEKGTLFLREDPGGTWEKVMRQWTGRAVLVRAHANATDTTGASPAPEAEEKPTSSGGVSQPDTVFELVNDQRQVWISADGRNWTAK